MNDIKKAFAEFRARTGIRDPVIDTWLRHNDDYISGKIPGAKPFMDHAFLSTTSTTGPGAADVGFDPYKAYVMGIWQDEGYDPGDGRYKWRNVYFWDMDESNEYYDAEWHEVPDLALPPHES